MIEIIKRVEKQTILLKIYQSKLLTNFEQYVEIKKYSVKRAEA